MRYGEMVAGRDAAFFFLEGRTTPYHMAVLGIAEGPPPEHAGLLAAVERKLPLLPRFRQRPVFPWGGGRPVWIEDAEFDLGYHLRRATVSEPGTERELREAIASLMEGHVSRHRPLWELWVLDGLAGGRWAFLLKVHHAMVDGVTGAHDVALLLDRHPVAPRAAAVHGGAAPTARPSGAAFAGDVLLERLSRPARVGGAALRAARHPGRLAASAFTLAAGAGSIAAAALHPAPRVPCNGRIGPNRVFDYAVVPLQDLKDVKDGLGGTVNDVVLTVVAGGLRTWLLSRGQDVDGTTMKALVPVSLRRPMDDVRQGNLVAGAIAPLPVGEPDPVERLGIVRRATARAKRSPQTAGTAMLLELPSLLPAPVTRGVVAVQRVQRFFNISMTNVRGPDHPLYLAGRRVRTFVPVAPLSANAGLIVGALSFDGSMAFGLLADPGLVPDLAAVAEGIEKSTAELLHVAVAGGGS